LSLFFQFVKKVPARGGSDLDCLWDWFSRLCLFVHFEFPVHAFRATGSRNKKSACVTKKLIAGAKLKMAFQNRLAKTFFTGRIIRKSHNRKPSSKPWMGRKLKRAVDTSTLRGSALACCVRQETFVSKIKRKDELLFSTRTGENNENEIF